jgi:hypothetical protein
MAILKHHDLCLSSELKKFGLMCYRIKPFEDTFMDILKLKSLKEFTNLMHLLTFEFDMH